MMPAPKMTMPFGGRSATPWQRRAEPGGVEIPGMGVLCVFRHDPRLKFRGSSAVPPGDTFRYREPGLPVIAPRKDDWRAFGGDGPLQAAPGAGRGFGQKYPKTIPPPRGDELPRQSRCEPALCSYESGPGSHRGRK